MGHTLEQPKRPHISIPKPRTSQLEKSKMVCFRSFIILMVVVAAMMPSTNSAPMPMPMPEPGLFDLVFPQAMARARANDRGANSFAGGAGRRIGGSFINPDPFAFPGESPFPAVPLFI